MCFKDLDRKPVNTAPHELVDGVNCISYRDPADLMNKISALSDEAYLALQRESIGWARRYSTAAVAGRLIALWQQHRDAA